MSVNNLRRDFACPKFHSHVWITISSEYSTGLLNCMTEWTWLSHDYDRNRTGLFQFWRLSSLRNIAEINLQDNDGVSSRAFAQIDPAAS
jgi:hypothetical protein